MRLGMRASQEDASGDQENPGDALTTDLHLLRAEKPEVIDDGGGHKLAYQHEENGITNAKLGSGPGDGKQIERDKQATKIQVPGCALEIF